MGATKEYPQDIFSAIASLEKQMERLAMKSPGPFGSLQVGDGTITTDNGDVVLTDNNGTTVIGSSRFIPSPTDVEVTTGTEVNESWARVTWVAPVGVTILGYEIVAAIPGQGVVRTDVVDPIFLQIQIQPLQPGEEYSFMVRALGITRNSAYVVATPDPITIGNDTTNPNVPTGFQMFGGFRSVYGIWNESTDYDVEKGKGTYEFEIDVVSTFNSGNQKTWAGKALIAPHLNLLPGVNTYYGRLRSRDSSGNPSAWTATLSVATSQTTVNDVGNGTLVTNHFIAGTIHGSIVTVGTLHGDRIIANTADIGIITTGSLTSQIVTIEGTAMLRIGRTAPPYNYLLLSGSSGFQVFKAGTAPFTAGDMIFETNITTGVVSIVGQLATATGGKRVLINPSDHFMYFYNGDAVEVNPSDISAQMFGTGSGKSTSLRLRAPQNSGTRGGELELYGQSADGTTTKRQAVLRSSGDGTGSYIQMLANEWIITTGPTSAGQIWANGANGQMNYDASNDGHDFYVSDFLRFEVKVDRLNVYRPLALNAHALHLRDAPDVSNTLGWHSGIDGPDLKGALRFLISGNGANIKLYGDGGRLRVENIAQTAGQPIEASAYNIWSDEKIKANRTPKTGMLSKLRETVVVEYDPTTADGKPLGKKRKLGIVAQEAPTEIRVEVGGGLDPETGETLPTYEGIDLGAEIAWVWGSLAEEADEREAIAARLFALEQRIGGTIG